MADTLSSLAREVACATGPDPDLDNRCWLLVGSAWATNFEEAWRKGLPIDPSELVNARTMAEAMRLFPSDVMGAKRCWYVPNLTASVDLAMRIFPDDWYVVRSHQWIADNFRWSLDFARRDMSLARPFSVEDCATEALARLSAALMARAHDREELV